MSCTKKFIQPDIAQWLSHVSKNLNICNEYFISRQLVSLDKFLYIILHSPFCLNCIKCNWILFTLYCNCNVIHIFKLRQKEMCYTILCLLLQDIQFSASEIVICHIQPSMKILHLNSLHLRGTTSCLAAAVPNIALFCYKLQCKITFFQGLQIWNLSFRS